MKEPDPLVGRVVAGRYEVLRPIGKGGMGSIYEVRHTRLSRSFALKRLRPELAADREALVRFRREADAVASLRHPNVVEVVDWETLDDGSPCIVMELLKGEDLRARITRVGPLPWGDIARIGAAALAALGVAHRAGIVHRDLKPQNIFLTVDDAGGEHVKLLDFGISKVAGRQSLTEDQRVLGTPLYMAPEQADGRQGDINAGTDVWAMGAMLFEMATGSPAFPAPVSTAIMYRICHGEPAEMLPLRPNAPAAFVSLVARALCRDPAQRVTSAEALSAELRAALEETAPDSPSQPRLAAPAPLSLSTLSLATGQTGTDSAPPDAASSPRWWWVGVAVLAVALAGAALLRPRATTVHEPPAPTTIAAPLPPPQPRVTPLVPAAPATPSTAIVVQTIPAEARLELDGAQVVGHELTPPVDGRAHRLRVSAHGYLSQSFHLDDKTPRHLEVVLLRGRKEPARATTPATPAAAKLPVLEP